MKAAIRRWLFVCGWIGLSVGPLAAQQRPASFEFRHIQEKDGLSFNFINCFLHDRDGFLWVGTYDGLNRYDGSHFVPFKHQRVTQNSLLNNTVQDICEGHDGIIWMAVESGISGYNKKAGRFRNITTVNGQALGSCTNILCDRTGNIWFSSHLKGLFRYQTQTGRIDSFPNESPTDSLAVRSQIPKNGLLLDPQRNGLWMADAQGLNYFDISQQRFINYRHNPQHLSIFTQHDVSALAFDGDDRLIFSDNTARQIMVYDLHTQRVTKTITLVGQSKPDVFDIATIFVDRQHNLWASSWRYTLFYIAANTYHVTEFSHNPAKNTSVAANFFWGAWQHPDGSVWLGTTNGISHTNPERAFYDTYDVGALFPALTDERGIISFQEDTDGSWWLGTSIRGLLHYFPRTNQLDVYKLPNGTKKYPYGLPISSLQPYGKDLYVGTENALFVFHKDRKAFTEIPLPALMLDKKMYLHCFFLQHDSLWITGNNKWVFRYQLTTKQWKSYWIPSASRHPQFMARYALSDRKGDLWLELYPEGFARFSKSTGQFELVDIPGGLPYKHTITSVTADKSGAFWIASNGYGLFRYEPRSKQLSHWTESEGLAFDYCSAALADQSGTIWVASNHRISVFTVAKNQFQNFSLPFNEADSEYSTYLFPLRNGHILSAQKGFLIEFKPERLTSTATKDTVLLNSIALSDTTHLLHRDTKRVHLSANDNTFFISYSVLAQPSQTAYRYLHKLDGYEDRWQESTSPGGVSYGKVPGGEYVFRVKAVDGNGIESPVSTLAVDIDTLFYKSVWFWVLVALVLNGLLYAFIRYRAQQNKKLNHLNLQASRLERDKAEIHYQNLINHLNPHFLFNSLTSLNSLITTKPKDASVFLRKLSATYRYILQNKDKELISLTDELNFTQNYIDLQKARFDEGLQITVTVAPPYLDRQIVPVTIQNLIENAIKHNTIGDDNPLIIRVYAEADSLYVSNNLQRKSFVETSNKQGLDSLTSLYRYLSKRPVAVTETATQFTIAIPLL
ncbi:ligand-binding sensor domain-containing protein [Spirosoma areae]